MSEHDPFSEFEPEQPATLEEEKPARESQGGGGDWLYNAISLVFVTATIAAIVGVVLLIQNPFHPINPFPPDRPAPTPTLFNPDGESGAGGEIAGGEAEDNGTGDAQPIEGGENAAALTPTATAPPPTATGAAPPPAPTNTPSSYPFALQNETLTYLSSEAFYPTRGCDYMAIAGQVFDEDGDPLTGVPVVVEGDERFSALDFTGNATQYGPSGYEIYINDQPYQGEFTVRLVSETGMALSETVIIRTSDSCEQNVVIVNFRQTGETP